MKKRLHFFIIPLLLFMLAGCGQTPEPPVTEASQTAVDSTTAIESNERDNLNTDADIMETDSSLDDSNAVFTDNKPDNDEGDSLPDSATADVNDDLNSIESDTPALSEDGSYTSKEDVALYIYQYGHLPSNFITKKEAEELGWSGGSLEPYAPGKCIGGNRFGNYEGLLPQKDGRSYTECDIDTLGADKRGAKRIVFSNDGLIYYTEDHYKSFELLYGEADP